MFCANLCICGGFNFLNSMLALMAIFIGAGYVVGFWLLKWFVLERLELKDDA